MQGGSLQEYSAEVRSELDAILSSACFQRSPRLSKLLSYLATKALSGEGNQLKDYTIAVEVLGKAETFDPSEDASARVEMHRLRKRLREYYDNEGATRQGRLAIPIGQYAPQYLSPTQLPTVSEAAPVSSTAVEVVHNPTVVINRPRRLGWMLLSVFILLAASAGALAMYVMGHRHEKPIPAPVVSEVETRSAGIVTPGVIRIGAGSTRAHTDRWGQKWDGDSYFEGGEVYESKKEFIDRAFDIGLFTHGRQGDFKYHIPLPSGYYELHLFFAETYFGPQNPGAGGEASRAFEVSANGKVLLPKFDILSDAGGPNIADVRVFKGISPGSDGLLHLHFKALRDKALLNGIEIVPADANRLNPIRMIAQDRFYTSSDGHVWTPENYISGGLVSTHIGRMQTPENVDADLFARERYGHFSYAMPVDQGTYKLTLYMAERHWGIEEPGGAGSRRFDVNCNGKQLIHDIDLFGTASGINRAVIRTFKGLPANAQGKLVLDFVPRSDYGSVYAIEIEEEK